MARKSKYNLSMSSLSKLCTPSFLYFIISFIALLVVAIQNFLGNSDTFCIGSYKCNIGNKMIILLLNFIYIVFWTFILNLMCKAGYSEISWFIVLIPIILFFLFFSIIMYKSSY